MDANLADKGSTETEGLKKDEAITIPTENDNVSYEELTVKKSDVNLIPVNEVEILSKQELQVKEKEITSSLSSFKGNYAEVYEANHALEDMRLIAQQFLKAQLCPLKSEADIILAIITGNQYGFNFITSVQNIYPINGRAALSTHLIRAQILKNGIIFEKINDYAPVYKYYKTEEKEGNFVLAVTKDNKAIEVGLTTDKELPNGNYARGNTIVDYITTYKFTRWVKTPVGWKEQNVNVSFTISEARQAQLLDKENWQKYPKRMLDARAFNYGAREIADDVIMGVYSISELADANNIKYTINENGEETIIN